MRIPTSIRAALLATGLGLATAAGAVEVAGQHIDDQVKMGTTDLVLNGAGIRTKLFIKVYVAALYLPQKTNNAGAILEPGGNRRVVLRLLRDIDADTLYGALRDGLKDNNSEADMAQLKAQVEQFADIMRKVGNAKSGDSITLDFADGVSVSHNGQARGKVPGAPFGKALLLVWLGDKPVDASLKKALLGN